MKVESRRLADVLLRRHRMICVALPRTTPSDVDDGDVRDSVLSYGDLCDWAGLGRNYAHPSGNFLVEIAECCHENGWPPLNALAVNGRTRYPGDGYGGAPGCRDWDDDVRSVIACTSYPERVG
jgi:hypothetical protein